MNKNQLLYEIMKYIFASVELNLYLDNFPKNKKALNDYNELSKRLNYLVCKYEDAYGPLINFGLASNQDSEKWTSKPWPWENR